MRNPNKAKQQNSTRELNKTLPLSPPRKQKMTHKSPKENSESRTPTKSRPKKSNRHQLMGLRFLLARALRRQKHAIPTAESTRPQLDNHHELPTQNKKTVRAQRQTVPHPQAQPKPENAQKRANGNPQCHANWFRGGGAPLAVSHPGWGLD